MLQSNKTPELMTMQQKLKGSTEGAGGKLEVVCAPRYLPCLKRLALDKVSDLWIYMPRTFIDVNWMLGLNPKLVKKYIQVKITIGRHRKQKNNYTIDSYTPSGELLSLVFFAKNLTYLKSMFPPGETKTVSGILTYSKQYKYQIAHPHLQRNSSASTKIKPVYGLTYGLNNDIMIAIINKSLALIKNSPLISFETYLQKLIKENHQGLLIQNWPGFERAVKKLHCQSEDEESENNLAFLEILANQIAISFIKQSRLPNNDKVISNQDLFANKAIHNLPFSLTIDQNKVIEEIRHDMASPRTMHRLLQGDVGSGKTIVALMAGIKVIESNYQVAFMVPTSIVAGQHYQKIKEILTGIIDEDEIVCLTGKTNQVKAKQRLVYSKIKSGRAKIVIGTHALFQEKVEFANLGLVIIDEQHKFGVEQRMQLTMKNSSTHILLMSATPIPRTLLMTMYADLDISYIRTKPKSRKPIITTTLANSKIPELAIKLKKAINEGKQVYWVCPLIEESEHLYLIDLEKRYDYLSSIIPDIAVLHGKLKADEKDLLIEQFLKGRKKLLLSTTVIEVGVDVPNADIIIIENAENFGIAQIHQLRGRVGRGDKQGYCILVYDERRITPRGSSRLKILQSSDDGFYIAEKDLSIRGGGDIAGIKQSGSQTFRFFDFARHSKFIPEARSLGFQVVKNYNTLTQREKHGLMTLLHTFNRHIE